MCSPDLCVFQRTVVFDLLLFQVIRSVFLVIGNDPTIERVPEHVGDVRGKPLFLAGSCQPPCFFQLVLDLCHTHSAQVQVIDHPYRFSLLRIDDEGVLIDAVISENIAVAVVNAIVHGGLLPGLDADGGFPALVLRQRCHDRQPQLPVTVKGLDVVVDEEHLNAVIPEQPGVLQRVYGITGKTGDLTGDDHVKLLRLGVPDHFHKARTLLCRRTGDSLVHILLGQHPIRPCRQNGLIPVHLVFQRRELRLVFRGNAGINCYIPFLKIGIYSVHTVPSSKARDSFA